MRKEWREEGRKERRKVNVYFKITQNKHLPIRISEHSELELAGGGLT